MNQTEHTPMMQTREQRSSFAIHMIGICGAGMSGIAELLYHLGYQVTGSDTNINNRIGRYLRSLGMTLFPSHAAHHLGEARVVVYSSAIDEDNVELLAARDRHIPCMGRAEMLADLIRYYYGIAVAGTHGKTTTTSLIHHIFAQAGTRPTYIAGARLLSNESHASIGSGQYFIIEADESDASFTHIHPVVTVITNIGEDHMHTYQHDVALLHQQYLEFVHNTPFYGTVVICGDDAAATSLAPKIHRKVVSYGLSEHNEYRGSALHTDTTGTHFVVDAGDASFSVSLALFGQHNVQNALAAIAVSHMHGIQVEAIQQALASFPGVSRRFNQYQCTLAHASVTLVDDYGHHPTEIAATLQTARLVYPEKRLVVVFQPHRYTRTHDLFDDFIAVLERSDLLLVCSTYAAGEQPIATADSRALCRSIRNRGRLDPILVGNVTEAAKRLDEVAQADDLIVIQGAGDIAQLVTQLMER